MTIDKLGATLRLLAVTANGSLEYVPGDQLPNPSIVRLNTNENPFPLPKPGALINLLNPKLTLFFVSFLPQFVPPTDPAPMLTMGLMGLVAQTFVVFLAYGAVAARAGDLLRRRPRIMVLFQTGIAVLFAGLGLRVILGGR